MHRGYIKIWRKIRDSFVWHDAECYKLFSHLIMEANYKDKEFMFNGKKTLIKRGQLICGLDKLQAETRIHKSKIYRLMKCLENETLIEQQKTNRYTIVSIVCYDDYQSNEQQNETPVKLQRNSSETPVKTSKELIRTKKNYKKEKISDEEFMTSLKTIYPDINLGREFGEMDRWLLKHPERIKSRRFITNWLNKAEKPIGGSIDEQDFARKYGV